MRHLSLCIGPFTVRADAEGRSPDVDLLFSFSLLPRYLLPPFLLGHRPPSSRTGSYQSNCKEVHRLTSTMFSREPPKKRKHDANSRPSYNGTGMFARSIQKSVSQSQGNVSKSNPQLSGFRDDAECDFFIACGGRIFHTHKLVLGHLEYFYKIFKGNYSVRSPSSDATTFALGIGLTIPWQGIEPERT